MVEKKSVGCTVIRKDIEHNKSVWYLIHILVVRVEWVGVTNWES